MTLNRLQAGAALLALMLALVAPPAVPQSEAAPSVAPGFEVITLGGEAYSKDSLTGQPVLLVFWAPWCKVCQKELPVLSQFSIKEKPGQLRMISIGFADRRGNVEAYIKAHPEAFGFPAAFDVDNDVAQAFKVTATPTLVLLDSMSNIVLTHRGAGLLQNVQFREFLSTLKG
jgi:thiol-disulfide isomerase/thioredoxin